MAEEKTTLGMTKEELDAKMAEIDARLKTEAPPEVPKAPTAKKVAVLGFTDSWKTAPFGDESWEIWGLNELYMSIPRWTRWFELHKREVYEADKKRVSDHVERLKQMTCPVYMHQHFDDIPTSVPYPLQAICDAFPNPTTGQRPYLTNSISYMILLAVYEGFEEIKICGVDMSHTTEYGSQRPSCEWAVGIAQGRGIKVWLPLESDLMKTNFLYGYEEEQANAFQAKMIARRDDIRQKRGQMEQQFNQLQIAIQQHFGAEQDIDHILKIWNSTPH